MFFEELTNFIKSAKQDRLLGLTVLFLGLLFPFVPRYVFAYWDNYRFILQALLPVFAILFLMGRGKRKKIQIIPFDLSWFIFIVIGFLSYFWALNKSLIWFQAFGWISLLLWMLVFRTLYNRPICKESLPKIFYLLSFIILTPVLLIILFGEIPDLSLWNHHFGFNANFTNALIIAFLPFLYVNPFEFRYNKILCGLITVLILYVVSLGQARGVQLCLLILAVYFLWFKLPKKYFGVLIILACTVSSIFFVGMLLPDTLLGKYLESKLYFGDSTRIYMMKCSLDIFLGKPFLGVGLGNWFTEAYISDLANIPGLNDPFQMFRPGNHNIYSQYIAELGALGFIALYFPVIIVFYNVWRKKCALSDFEKASFGSLLVYLTACLFYQDANFYEFHYSGLQLLAFITLGILTSKEYPINYSVKFKYVFLIASLLSTIWFSYNLKIYNKYFEVMELSRAGERNYTEINYDSAIEKHRRIGGGKEVIQLLESIYHPIFKENHLFYQGGLHKGRNNSIPLLLAQLYVQEKEFDLAEKYFSDWAFQCT